VMEPRNLYDRGHQDNPQDVQRGKPTVSCHRKAAVPETLWRADGTPPGSESGACISRGNSGTWESHLSPCATPGMGDRTTKSPGVRGGFAPHTSPVGTPRTNGSTQGIGTRATSEAARDGQGAVFVEHSTEEGGEARPKRPTGGKATPGITRS